MKNFPLSHEGGEMEEKILSHREKVLTFTRKSDYK